jgi:hypothetical protein
MGFENKKQLWNSSTKIFIGLFQRINIKFQFVLNH